MSRSDLWYLLVKKKTFHSPQRVPGFSLRLVVGFCLFSDVFGAWAWNNKINFSWIRDGGMLCEDYRGNEYFSTLRDENFCSFLLGSSISPFTFIDLLNKLSRRFTITYLTSLSIKLSLASIQLHLTCLTLPKHRSGRCCCCCCCCLAHQPTVASVVFSNCSRYRPRFAEMKFKKSIRQPQV